MRPLAAFTHLVPWMRLYLWELKFCVVWIHALYLLPRWSSQNLQEIEEYIHYLLLQEFLCCHNLENTIKQQRLTERG